MNPPEERRPTRDEALHAAAKIVARAIIRIRAEQATEDRRVA